ncbi:hypothetical protein GCM10009085_24310 [Pseudomonas avellanae]|nr:hypothetical protein GCM10009085_24310 [Pseudomonas avellanae]
MGVRMVVESAIRTGDVRIVYRINGTEIVLVLCVGARRDDEVYEAAYRRV